MDRRKDDGTYKYTCGIDLNISHRAQYETLTGPTRK